MTRRTEVRILIAALACGLIGIVSLVYIVVHDAQAGRDMLTFVWCCR